MFDTWSLDTELNVPMLSAKCYRGLEDPRNFNKTHFLAAVQVGDDCVTRQALVTKGAIVLLNGPTDSKRSEKNWVKFSDGVLVYQLCTLITLGRSSYPLLVPACLHCT